MDVSLFLAKVLGFYFIIMSLALLLNKQKMQDVLLEINNMSALLFITGVFSLIVGLLITVSHNIWELDWRIIITIIGWLSLIKGILRITFPRLSLMLASVFAEEGMAYHISLIILLALGVCLAYLGLMH